MFSFRLDLDLGNLPAKVQRMLFKSCALGYPSAKEMKGNPMIRPLALLLVASVAVSGCSRISNSKINPMNWFGSKSEAAVVYEQGQAPALVPSSGAAYSDARALIDTISVVELARTPSGAILRATGIAASQGAYNAELVLVSSEGNTATYEFRIETPAGLQVQGATATRELTAAEVISANELKSYRNFVVKGARNTKSAR